MTSLRSEYYAPNVSSLNIHKQNEDYDDETPRNLELLPESFKDKYQSKNLTAGSRQIQLNSAMNETSFSCDDETKPPDDECGMVNQQ